MEIAEKFDKILKDLEYPKFKKNDSEDFILKEKRKYRMKVDKINNDFIKALFIGYDIYSNPKKDILCKLAWDYGHSSGYNEIEIYFEELVDLIR